MFDEQFNIYFSPYLLNLGGSTTAIPFRRSLDLKLKIVFVDPQDRLIVLYVGGSNACVFRRISGRPDFFRLLVPDWNVTLDMHLNYVGTEGNRRECKTSKTCSNAFNCLTGTELTIHMDVEQWYRVVEIVST